MLPSRARENYVRGDIILSKKLVSSAVEISEDHIWLPKIWLIVIILNSYPVSEVISVFIFIDNFIFAVLSHYATFPDKLSLSDINVDVYRSISYEHRVDRGLFSDNAIIICGHIFARICNTDRLIQLHVFAKVEMKSIWNWLVVRRVYQVVLVKWFNGPFEVASCLWKLFSKVPVWIELLLIVFWVRWRDFIRVLIKSLNF